MATEQVIEDRVLNIYTVHKELMAEQVFPIYEQLYGETSRSNSIHTTISRLTKKGLLFVIRRDVSPLTKKTVNVWHIADGTLIPVVDVVHKASNSELTHEAELLRIKNKNLEEANLKLYGIIERLREELDNVHKDNAGVDL